MVYLKENKVVKQSLRYLKGDLLKINELKPVNQGGLHEVEVIVYKKDFQLVYILHKTSENPDSLIVVQISYND